MRHDPIDPAFGPIEAGGAAGVRVAERMTMRPVTVRADAPLSTAWTVMRQRRIRRLPVVDARGRLIGIVTERDVRGVLVDALASIGTQGTLEALPAETVGAVMTPDPATVAPHTELREAARLMHERAVGGLPVVDGGRLVGIITRTDILARLDDMLGTGWRPDQGSDERGLPGGGEVA